MFTKKKLRCVLLLLLLYYLIIKNLEAFSSNLRCLLSFFFIIYSLMYVFKMLLKVSLLLGTIEPITTKAITNWGIIMNNANLSIFPIKFRKLESNYLESSPNTVAPPFLRKKLKTCTMKQQKRSPLLIFSGTRKQLLKNPKVTTVYLLFFHLKKW